MRSRQAIAVIGKSGSGKTTLAQIMALSGFEKLSLSDAIKGYAHQHGHTLGDAEVRAFADEIRALHGPSFFAALLIDQMANRSNAKIVVEGIRSLKTLELFRSWFSSHDFAFLSVGLFCSDGIRLTRVIARARGDTPVELSQTFRGDESAHFTELDTLVDSTDVVFRNEGEVAALNGLAVQITRELSVR